MIAVRIIFFIFAILFSACTHTPREDEALARVNGKAITIKDYLVLFDSLKPKDLSLAGKDRGELKNLVLKSLVRRQVILSESEKKNIRITEDELEKGIKQYRDDYGSGLFEQTLLEQMIDKKEWEEQIRQNLLIEKLFASSEPKEQPPSSQEIAKYYQDHPHLFRREAFATALQIVVADKDLADEIRQKLRNHPKDFLTLARKHSIGPEAQSDGKIKIQKGVMPEAIDRFLFESRLNEISNVLSSPYGFHILKVLDRIPAINYDFEQVKDEISKHLKAEQKKSWLMMYEEKLLRNASIEYNRKLIAQL